MTLFWLPSVMARLGCKRIAQDDGIPKERKAHAVVVLGAMGALARSVAAPVHNPWLYAVHGLCFGALAVWALHRAQRWEHSQQKLLLYPPVK